MTRSLNIFMPLFLACTLLLVPGCSSDPQSNDSKATPSYSGKERQRQVLAFGGGPTGGTFNFFANKMASIISARYDWLDVSPKGSGGSAENLRTLNKNGVDIGIVYSGDAFLGRNGKLPNDTTRYDRVRVLSFLYGAPAQLVVRRDSGINSAYDLKGKVVAIGNPGSGAALSAERFFKHIGLWPDMELRNLGYSQAAADFSDRKIDAFWVLVGYPNSSIIEATSRTEIKLLNLHRDAVESGFYETYPFYSKVEIPARTYQGQDAIITTFQDASLWCASESLSDDTVYESLTAVFSEQGLTDMITAHKAARNMSIDSGLKGASIPLHPGAVRFWQEHGVHIPPKLLPQ